MPLEKYGLTIPHDLVEESWNRIWNKGYIHEVAQFFATGWFANYWRIDGMDDTDFEWFEHKYPGWYDKYGKWWERYSDYSVKNGRKPIAFEPGADYEYPHRCWSCMVPCLIREDMVATRSTARCAGPTARRPATGPTRSRSARSTRGRPTPAMGQLTGKREWETLYHGMDVAEIMEELGYVRDDGHTPPAAAPQPRPEEDVAGCWTRPAATRSRARTSSSTRCPPRTAREYVAKYKRGGAAGRPAAA